MTTMSDLSDDLVEEILCRVPVTCIQAVRSTCKGWYTLSKTRIVCKAEARHHILGLISFNLCSVGFNLHGILNEDGKESVDPSVKPIGNLLNLDEISNVFSCDGLLLCVTRNNSELLVWNRYLGQIRWIRTSNNFCEYALGYDNNKNHKILRFLINENCYQIYDLKSRSWSLFYVIPNRKMRWYNRGTSLNGNTYFLCRERKVGEVYGFLCCFDFTTERFGQLIDLPFSHYFRETVRLSCVKEEKLAAFYQCADTFLMEIWVTTKIEPNAASWSKFLKIDTKPPTGFDFVLNADDGGSFFIDEEKKVAVVFSFGERHDSSYSAYIIGDNRYLKVVDLEIVVNCQEESVKVRKHWDYLVFSSSYVPSLVQINQIAGRRRKEKKECKNKDKKRKRTNKV